jgi:hypothetical protein
MNEIFIKNFQMFHDVVQSYHTSTDIFRGVLDANYKLIPKLGRPEIKLKGPISRVEGEVLRLFKDYATPYLPNPNLSNWELLAIAQHHGLPTRLLDWSRNPLVAAYFAVEHDFAGDSAVYVLKAKGFIDINKWKPFEIEEVSKFIPPHITPRITAQSGLFTIHPNPSEPFVADVIDKLIIMNEMRRGLKRMLYKYGIHRASLFPGMDGIASYIQWLKTESF